jgi:hypothetical protein
MESQQKVRICWCVLKTQYKGHGSWLDKSINELKEEVRIYNQMDKNEIIYWVECTIL